MKIIKYEFFCKVRKFRTLQKIRTLPKYSYFMIFILYQKIRTLPKISYFTEIFVLDGKFRTPDVQVLGLCKPTMLRYTS